MLKMIETNEFILEGVEITRRNLYLFLYNFSQQTVPFLEKNAEKVQSLVDQMKPHEIWKCIAYFRLGSRRGSINILNNLVKSLNKFNVNYDEYSPIFLGKILIRNSADKHINHIEHIKQFFKNALEFFTQKNRIGKISLEDHI